MDFNLTFDDLDVQHFTGESNPPPLLSPSPFICLDLTSTWHTSTATKKLELVKHVAEGLGFDDPTRVKVMSVTAGSVIVATRAHGFENEEDAHAHHSAISNIHEHLAQADMGFGACSTSDVKVGKVIVPNEAGDGDNGGGGGSNQFVRWVGWGGGVQP